MSDRPAGFEHADLTGAQFHDVELQRARFRHVDFSGSRFSNVALSDVVITESDLFGVRISGDVRDFVINGVDVAPLVEAELDRRDPERVLMRARDADGIRAAWQLIERRWSQTVERASALPPEALHEQVNGEWSFIQTLRHLVFATDTWVRRVILGDPRPWHRLALPFDGMTPHPEIPWDRDARPALAEVLAVRADRMAGVRELIDGITDAQLATTTTPVDGPGWPPAREFPLGEALGVVLNEEWQHRRYAERDLAVLEARG